MIKIIRFFVWLLAFFSCTAFAQTWALYAPPERDFRVLFPGTPERLVDPSGSVEYRFNEGQQIYSVFRHDPRRAGTSALARSDVIQRLSGIGGERRVQSLDEGSEKPNEFMFRAGNIRSVHRVIVEPGRYYELVVGADEFVPNIGVQEFFQSFQVGSTGIFPLFTNLPTPDSCQTRGGIGRRFCEYLTCLIPDYRFHPVCTSLPPLLQF